MAEKLCWFTATYRMRAGRSGWICEGHSRLQYERDKRLEVQLSMTGTIRASISTLRAEQQSELPQSRNERPIFFQIGADIDNPDKVEVTVAVAFDESGIIELSNSDYDRAVQIATAALLRKYPDTTMFVKPND